MTYNYSRRLAHPFYANMDPTMIGKARELRKNMTKAEQKLWQHLRQKKIMETKFRRQHPIDRFILDFYCHDARLVIEVDGGYHNDEDQQVYDEGRTQELMEMGLEIIRFTNNEVESNIEEVIEKIKLKLKTRIQVPPWFGEGCFRTSSFAMTKGRGKKNPLPWFGEGGRGKG